MDQYMMPDVAGLMEKVRRQQEQVERIQRGVETMEVTATSRGNEVTVKLRGNGRFTEISIDPESVRRYDAQDLGDIVMEAVNEGLRKLAEASSKRFAPVIEAAARLDSNDG